MCTILRPARRHKCVVLCVQLHWWLCFWHQNLTSVQFWSRADCCSDTVSTCRPSCSNRHRRQTDTAGGKAGTVCVCVCVDSPGPSAFPCRSGWRRPTDTSREPSWSPERTGTVEENGDVTQLQRPEIKLVLSIKTSQLWISHELFDLTEVVKTRRNNND